MKLIVGLGNPGKSYNETRHNIGFMVLNKLAKDNNLTFNRKKQGGEYCEASINGEKVIFLKPNLFINLSGEAISSFIKYFKIDINDMLIISDDLDLKVGKYKIRFQGSSGGHNGLKNIEQALNTKVYNRLRIGISNNKEIDTKDYVLGKFNLEEKEKIDKILLLAKDIVIDFITNDMNTIMNKYNKK
jgi:PTH1 family peptidyl-tRNA hydrolase